MYVLYHFIIDNSVKVVTNILKLILKKQNKQSKLNHPPTCLVTLQQHSTLKMGTSSLFNHPIKQRCIYCDVV